MSRSASRSRPSRCSSLAFLDNTLAYGAAGFVGGGLGGATLGATLGCVGSACVLAIPGAGGGAAVGAAGGGVAGIVYGLYLDITRTGPFSDNVEMASGPLAGFEAGDTGASEWGRRHGEGASDGRGRFHRMKPRVGAAPADDLYVNPETGDVIDSNGDHLGNLGDENRQGNN